MLEFARNYLLIDSTMISIAYAVTLVAYVVRDILPLRVLLIGAALAMLGFGLRSGSEAIAFWNALFIGVNAVHVGLLVRERRPTMLDAEQQRVYERVFWIMWPREFRRLWRRGREIRREDGRLCSAGEVPHHLYLLLEGTVSIERGGKPIARVEPLHMIGEMSFINRGTATADAVVREPVRVCCWGRDDLERLERSDPALVAKLNVVIGQDLVRKLTGPEEIRAEVTASFEEPAEIVRGPAVAS